MAFNAPDLVTNLDAVNYPTELDQNFTKIDTAFSEIESELPEAKIATGSGNTTWISFVLGQTGIVGTESFDLSFGTDHETLTISHPSGTPGKSGVVVNGLLHQTDVVVTKDLTTLVSSDGTFRIIIGAVSRGAPTVEIKVLRSDQTDDLDNVDLVLFDFDLTRSSGTYTVTNLRRQTTLLLDRSTFKETLNFVIPFRFNHNAVGRGAQQLVIPNDCELLYGYAAPETSPDQGTDPEFRFNLEIDHGTETFEILLDDFVFTEGPIVSDRAEGLADPFQLEAGDIVFFNIKRRDYGVSFQTCHGSLVLRKIFREVLR